MKVFFDIITNHTADVIDYAEQGQYTYVDKATSPYRDADGQRVRRPRLRRRRHLPGAGRRDVVPVHAGLPHATPTQTVKVAGLAQRPDAVPQPRRLDLRRRVRRVRRLRRASTTCSPSGPRSSTGMDDIYKTWVDFGIDGFRIDTVKHVNMEFWQQFAPGHARHAAKARQDDFFMFGEVYDADPAFMSQLHDDRQAAGDARLRLPGQRASASPRASRRRACATSSPATTTTPTPTPTPTSCRPSSATTTWAASACCSTAGHRRRPARARRARPRADVPHPRPAGRLLRRRAGLHRRRRRQGRAAGHVRQPGRRATTTTPLMTGTPRQPRTATTPTRPLYQQIVAALRSCGRPTRRSPTARRSTGTPRDGAGIFAVQPDRRRRAGRVRRRRQQRDHGQDGHLRHLQRRTARSRPIYGGRASRHARSDGQVDRHRAAAVGVGVQGRPRHGQAQDARRRSTLTVARRRRRASADAPRSAPRSRTDAFAQVTFAWRPVGTTAWQRSAPTTTRRTASSTTSAGSPRAPWSSTARWPRTSAGNLSATSSLRHRRRPGRRRRRCGGVGPVTQPDASSACPGDHNSEMGCAGDWQPDCDAGAADARRRTTRSGRARYTAARPAVRLQGRDRQERGTRTTAPAARRTAANIALHGSTGAAR